jgi:hypothetical protein
MSDPALIDVTAVQRALGNVTPLAPSFGIGNSVIVFTGEAFGTDTIAAPGAPWVELSANVNAHGARAFGLYSTTGVESMPTFNWGGSNRGWAFATSWANLDPSFTTGATPADRQANTTGSVIGSAGTKTSTINRALGIIFGGHNKTATANGATYTAPSGFTMLQQDVPSGAANASVAACYGLFNTTDTIAANTAMTLSVVDTSSTMDGSIFMIAPNPTTPLAGSPGASTSATGVLTSANIAGPASISATASAALTTAIKAAAVASAGTSATAALTNWTTVTLGGTQYTGSGGIHDPALIAQGWDPQIGTTISYDASNATVYANGEISSITNNCSFVAQYFDGLTWRTAVIIITPQVVSYATVAAAAVGALTTAIQMAASAVAVASAHGDITSAIRLVGSAASIANASGALLSGVQLNVGALANVAASGALSGGQASLQGNASALTVALGTLTAKIQLAVQVAANSLVAGALSTKIIFISAAQSLTQASASLTSGIQLAGNANVSTSAAGAALIITNLAGAAAAVSQATGALLTGLMVAGDAIAQAAGSGSLDTGIQLSGGAIVDSVAAITPVGSEGQFGYATINVLSPTGLPVDLAVFIEGSAVIATIEYFNAKGAPFVPVRVQYRVADIVSGLEIVPYTDITDIELSNAITIPGNQNVMISLSRDSEQHQLLFKISDALGGVNYQRKLFEIVTPAGGIN